MFKFFNKKTPAVSWFVVISLLAFFALASLFLYFSSYINQEDGVSVTESLPARILDISNDPFITFPGVDKDNITEPIINGLDPVWGEQGAPVRIVYFSDYDCQYCGEQIEMIKEVSNSYGDKVEIIWKDYPDLNKGSLSFLAALAGRCAQEQNRFWEFETSFMEQFSVFKVQQGKNYEAFGGFILGIAQELDLKLDTFQECVSNQDALGQIESNITEAQDLGLPGVPFTFINKREVLGQYGLEELKQIIKQELSSE